MGCIINPYQFGTIDPYWPNVVLLTGFEGTNGSVAPFSEESASAKTITPFNGAKIDTSQFKFGSSSAFFDGTNDYMQLSDSADWSFGAGDFTVEAWLRFNSVSGFRPIIGQYGTNDISWFVQRAASSNVLDFGWTSNGSTLNAQDRSWTPSTGQWYHFAVDRSGTTQRLYVDGVMLGASATNSATIYDSAQALLIGKVNLSTFSGWMDELRITKGVARYASDSGYTVPTAAFPRG